MSVATWLRQTVPAALQRWARRVAARPRYWAQLAAARRGFRRHGRDYPQATLYVAGLPKSGTSWLEGMLAAYPGYHPVVVPEAVAWEIRHGGSHDFPLPGDLFERLEGALSVVKLHAHGADGNAERLHRHEVPYVVLYRDLRDVAVSHLFYVKRTPWHPEHPTYAPLGVEESLLHFADTLLPDFVAWVRSWRRRCDTDLGMEVTYRQLRADTEGVFTRVVEHFGLPANRARVHRIVKAHRFRRRSGGRRPGQEDRDSFVRKGTVGDWRQHFTPDVATRFRKEAGPLLDEFDRKQMAEGEP